MSSPPSSRASWTADRWARAYRPRTQAVADVADAAARKRLLEATCLDRYLTLIEQPPASTGTFQAIEPVELGQSEMGRHMKESHAALGELPSPSAEAFQRIADMLESELDDEEVDEDPGLYDTVIVSGSGEAKQDESQR